MTATLKSLIPAAEFAQRRQQLMQNIGADAMAIVPAALHYRRNRDTEYRFRQDSDFYYLSGFAEPSWSIGLACLLVTGGAVLAAKDMILRKPSTAAA